MFAYVLRPRDPEWIKAGPQWDRPDNDNDNVYWRVCSGIAVEHFCSKPGIHFASEWHWFEAAVVTSKKRGDNELILHYLSDCYTHGKTRNQAKLFSTSALSSPTSRFANLGRNMLVVHPPVS